jgi:hypothetical protein
MRLRAVAAAALACAQAACGGAGEDPVAVTFSPAVATACVVQGWSGNAVLASTATLSHVPPDVQRVNVVIAGAGLDPRSVAITAQGENQFAFSASAQSGLALGTYAGTISFQLCKDAACSSTQPMAGATLPYALEVTTDPVLVVSSGGATLVGGGWYNDDYAVVPGARVLITADRPVTWALGSSWGMPDVEVIATTATSWTGTITGTPSASIEVRAYGACIASSTGAYFSMALPLP